MRYGCTLSLIIAFVPRLVMGLLWLFTPRVDLAFAGSFLLPLLGLIFLPLTTFAYVLVWAPLVGVAGVSWLLVVGGLILDLGIYALGTLLSRPKIDKVDSFEETANGNDPAN
jgi:hypothetical protein